jgi:hypothetical protein
MLIVSVMGRMGSQHEGKNSRLVRKIQQSVSGVDGLNVNYENVQVQICPDIESGLREGDIDVGVVCFSDEEMLTPEMRRELAESIFAQFYDIMAGKELKKNIRVIIQEIGRIQEDLCGVHPMHKVTERTDLLEEGFFSENFPNWKFYRCP